VTLVIGFRAFLAPFKGGTLVLPPEVLLLGLPGSPDGSLLLAAAWPTGLAPGTTLSTRYRTADAAGVSGFATSDGGPGRPPLVARGRGPRRLQRRIRWTGATAYCTI
jgi:hypothetical protein